MKKQNRKAFTIVELVIVIAVIGILAAVLIPTFSGIIESANRAVDTQLVAQINTTLAVEDVLSGGINEVVDIQNAIKKHGLKLETKSKGAYLWYDRDSGKVVLGSLDENNNLEIIFGDDSQQSNSLKGKFDINMIALEGFIHGYYFISEESNDKFAEKICAVRNSDSESELTAALNDVTNVNASIGQQFRVFLNTHPLITSSGVVFLGGDENRANATTAIVGGRVTEITANVIDQLKAFDTAIDHIDLHPGVTAVDVSIGSLDIEFFHSSLEVDAFCKEKGITNVHLKGERDKFIQSMNIVYIDTNGDRLTNTVGENEVAWSGNNPELNKIKWKITLAPWLDSQSTDTDKVYDFVGYSFEDDGSTSISLGTSNYFLTEADKTKVNENTGAITIYAVFDVDTTADFKIGDKFYGSRAVTYMLYTGVIPGNNITVCSTNAVLDASMIGLANVTLTIPSGVELLLPWQANFSKVGIDMNDPSMSELSISTKSGQTKIQAIQEKIGLTDPATTYNKALMTGKTNLTIASNVELNVETGGSLFVDAKIYCASTNYQCLITNDCGVLVLDGTINSNGDIHAYGVIRGQGEIIASEGAVVEAFTILDWPGGTIASNNINNGVTPFNNWLADCIRAKMTLQQGVKYSALGAVDVSIVGTQAMEFVLVDDDSTSTNPLFLMEAAGTEVQKTYGDGYELAILSGTVKDTRKEVTVANAYTIKFYEMPMPLPNFDFTIKAGASLELNNCLYKVLPGSEVIVEEAKDGKNAGKLTINTQVAFYDSFDLKMIECFKKGDEVDVDLGDVSINDCKYENGLKKVTVTGKYAWSTSTGSCVVISYPQTVGYNTPAKLLVNGELAFGSKAVFTGNVESSVNGAKITVDENAKFENKGTPITDINGKVHNVHGFKEGVAANIKLNIVVAEVPITFNQPTYDASIQLTGKFMVDLDYEEIPDGSKNNYKPVYIYNGNEWE